jgi:hypothetical protein
MVFHEEPGDEEAREYARLTRRAERVMTLFLALVAVATTILGMVIMFDIGGGRDRLGSRLMIAVPAVIILGAIDTQVTRVAQRRRPLLAPDPPEYRRLILRSTLGVLAACALLLALALFLP